MAGFKETPSNKSHERLNQNSMKLWFFMGGKRWLVTGLLVTIVFITLLIAGYLYPTVEISFRDNDSIDTLFQALLTAIISGVTIVVSLNQLVLSQELGAVKDQRERMEGAMKFRKDTEDLIEVQISPSKPAEFIRALVQAAGKQAENLQNEVSDSTDENFRQEINDFSSHLIKNSRQVAKELDGAQFGEFEVISSALNFNYSWKIFTARKLKNKFNDLLTQKEKEELAKLIDILNLFASSREHFKTLYFQSNLIELSRRILLAAIPALLVSCYMILFFNSKTFDIETLLFITALTTTISLLPFLILISYVLRIATITKHTLSIGSFILNERNEKEEIKWK